MVRLVGTVGRLARCKVLVAGDMILDTYTVGKASRISPEAPVAVVRVLREENRAGGSGNVVLNLLSLGADVVVMGRIGQDAAGQTLFNSLRTEGADVSGIAVQEAFPTPVKTRIIAENQQIVRVDREEVAPLSPELEAQLIARLPVLLDGVDLVAISDYGKGFFTPELLSALIAAARQREICVVADPKGVDFNKYRGAHVVKPNLSEAIIASGLPAEAPLDEIAKKVLTITQSDVLMITRSQDGISLFFKEGHREDFPTRVREIRDVTGAGDTVLAMIGCALGCGLDIVDAAHLSNVAAGIAIERFGCARVSLSEVARRVLESDVANKVFDEEHLFALKQALDGLKVAVVGMRSSDGLSPKTFTLLRQLAQRDQWAVLVYLRDDEPDPHFVDMLVSLREVNFIIFRRESLNHLCSEIHPDEVYVVEEGLARALQGAEELVTV